MQKHRKNPEFFGGQGMEIWTFYGATRSVILLLEFLCLTNLSFSLQLN